MILTSQMVKDALQQHASADDAMFLQRYFKTGEGQYGVGDIFIGVRVPLTRRVCKEFRELPLGEVQILLSSRVHEHRLAAVLLLVDQYNRADQAGKRKIYELYMRSARQGYVNNWDIVDSSAGYIAGAYLLGRSHDVLDKMADSDNVWQRRVAIMSTSEFIKNGDPSTTLIIAEKLLHDQHDLIQKAVGWMLREVGKRVDRRLLLQFLDQHAREMPRTMLRYSLEHLPQEQRAHYLALGVATH